MAFELSGTVNLGEKVEISMESQDPSGRYQFLYSGVSKGSNYSIYGKFNSSYEGKTCTIHNAEFILAKYNGYVSLGISKVDFDGKLEDHWVPTLEGGTRINCISFTIHVAPGLQSLKPYPIKLDKDNTFNLPNNGEYFLRVNPIKLPIYPKSPNSLESRLPKAEDEFFDTDYFDQSGILYTPKNQIENTVTTNSKTQIMESISANPGMAPWGSCIGGYSRIVIAK